MTQLAAAPYSLESQLLRPRDAKAKRHSGGQLLHPYRSRFGTRNAQEYHNGDVSVRARRYMTRVCGPARNEEPCFNEMHGAPRHTTAYCSGAKALIPSSRVHVQQWCPSPLK